MELIETSIFTKQINRLLDEKTYAEFREYLIFNPLKGKLIKGGVGIRKINCPPRLGELEDQFVIILHGQASFTNATSVSISAFVLLSFAQNVTYPSSV